MAIDSQHGIWKLKSFTMKNSKHPNRPKPYAWVNRLLTFICDPDLLEGILGDLEEKFERRLLDQGASKAKFWYLFDALGFTRPFAWKKFKFHLHPFIQITMIRHYAKIAWRNLLRHKMNTAINLMGLSMGILACIMIGLFVWDELKYDRFNSHADQIYRVYDESKSQSGVANLAMVPPTFSPTLEREFPEVAKALRLSKTYGKLLFEVREKSFLEEKGIFSNDDIFQFFDIELLAGNNQNALTKPTSIIISQELANKYFADQEALGQTIKIRGNETTVTGVFKKPKNFHLSFDFALAFSALENMIPEARMQSWVWQQFHSYVKLKPGAKVEDLQDKFQAYVKEHAWPQTEEMGFSYLPFFQPLKQVHLYSSDFRWDIAERGNITHVRTLILVGIFLLLIACINFINLSTARAERRAKEVGVRKVAGARRHQLISQFIGEGIFIAVLAMLFSIVLSRLLLPYLNAFTGKEIIFNLQSHPWMFLILLGSSVVLGLLAGSYPAFILSAFRPISILGGKSTSGAKRGIFVRKGLVVVQFSLSVLLIIGAIIMYQQVNYLNQKSLGFDREQVMLFSMKGAMFNDFEQTKTEFLRVPQVLHATTGYGFPGDIIAGDLITRPELQQTFSANLFTIDHDYIQTMGMEIINGRDFSKEMTTDADEAFILNETAVRELGFESPASAIGQNLHWNMWNHNQALKKGKVIGVVKDFHYKSLHERVSSAVLHIYPSAFYQMALRLQTDDLPATIASIKAVWDNFDTGQPFDYSFIDENFEAMYTAEVKMSKLLILFTMLTIFVACIGLLGLVAYAAEQRTKEIGIRKVLGASSGNILALLSKDFLKLVLLAIVPASIAGWFLMQYWLENFPYRIELSIWVFALAGIVILFIALLTVCLQSLQTALRNPVNALRYE